MLPGGVGVVGLYAFCSEGSFKSSLPALQKATTALPVAAQSGEALVLHADSTSRNKFAAKRRAGGCAHARGRDRGRATLRLLKHC